MGLVTGSISDESRLCDKASIKSPPVQDSESCQVGGK